MRFTIDIAEPARNKTHYVYVKLWVLGIATVCGILSLLDLDPVGVFVSIVGAAAVLHIL